MGSVMAHDMGLIVTFMIKTFITNTTRIRAFSCMGSLVNFQVSSGLKQFIACLARKRISSGMTLNVFVKEVLHDCGIRARGTLELFLKKV